MSRRPTIRPLDGREELAVRRALTETLMTAWDRVDGWPGAERLALDLLADLRNDGFELLKVQWP